MKKIVLTLVAVFLFTAMYAQVGFHVGALVGVGQSSILNKNDMEAGAILDYKSTMRPSFGLQLQYNFSQGLGIGTQLLYAGAGQKYTGVNSLSSSITYDFENQVNYFKIPILLHFNTNPEKMLGFHAYLGPQFGILVGGKTTATYYSSGTSYSTYEADKDGWSSTTGPTTTTGTFSESPYKSMDLGVVLGLGANINLSERLILQAGLRLDYGVGDMENKDSKRLIGTTDIGYTWPQNGPKMGATIDDPKREASHNANGSFVVGIKYVL